jgi:DNA gyrase/topoisomerase IV subunit B
MQKNEIKTLSQKEHVLKRPGLYLGSVNELEEDGWLYNKEEN